MNSASAVKFLYAAYTATWLIHGFYIVSLVRRYRKLRQQVKDLASGSRLPASGQQN
jgi:CcmD family protein